MSDQSPEGADAPSAPTPLLPHVIVLFGATGDLAARKLLPGLLHLAQSGMMPEYRIVGVARSELTDEEFRHLARHACDQYATGKISLLQWAGFEQRLSFVPHSAGPDGLAAAVAKAEASIGGEVRRQALALARAGLIHNVTSDAHDETGRPPGMADELEQAGLHVTSNEVESQLEGGRPIQYAWIAAVRL